MTDDAKMPTDEPTTDEMTAQAEGGSGEETMPMPEVRVEDLLGYTIGLFSDLAWIKLGIRANPATGDTTFDSAQAKLAIDALAALVPLLEGRFDAYVVRDLRNQLASLQMNFVQRQG